MKKTDGRLSTQIRIALGLLAALSSAAAIAIAVFASVEADRSAILKQHRLVEHSFEEEIATLEHEIETVTIWDDHVLKARAADQQWLAENVGDWMYDTYGHDRSIVFNAENRPVYVMRHGETEPRPRLQGYESAISDAAADLRQRLVAGIAQGAAAEDRAAIDEIRLVTIGQMPAILIVKPILPFTDRTVVEPGKEYLYASVQYLDSVMAEKIGSHTLLADMRFEKEPESEFLRTDFAIKGTDGAQLVRLGWEADRPGFHILKQVLPGGLVALLLLGAIAFVFSRGLRQASRDLHDSEQRARHLATHDVLTRLPNRGLFEERLNETLAKVRTGNGEAAVLFMDLDRFKNINDTLGHRAGDELVRQAAARLRTVVGERGTVARIGGDEFGMVLWARNGAENAATEISEALLSALEAPFELQGETVHVGVSIGIALAPRDGNERQEMLRKADIALYDAKKKGRGCYRIFSESMGEILAQRRAVEADLRNALEQGGELKLHYQPLLADDGGITGAEALLRWGHPVHGTLSPMFVISVAEESGLIMQLGDWILSEACRMALRSDLPLMSVNVSAVQLRDENFADRCLAIIRKQRVDPSRIQIEVTETVLIENQELAIKTFVKLRKAGIRVAIDDFGTGYSSMSYLQSYPVDRLKIDRTFVQAMSDSEQGRAIIAAMLGMARALELDVIAEGVETDDQWQLLQTLGCHEMQGYLFSKPLDQSAFLKLIQKNERLSA